MRQNKKLPFNPDKFFWAFCKATRYISEPETSAAGERFVSVHTYDKDMATTLKVLVTLTFDIKGILTDRVDGTKFIIKY